MATKETKPKWHAMHVRGKRQLFKTVGGVIKRQASAPKGPKPRMRAPISCCANPSDCMHCYSRWQGRVAS